MVIDTSPLQSFIEGSNSSCFSIHNLPYGAFYHIEKNMPRIGVAIGDYVLDLTFLEEEGLLKNELNQSLFSSGSLNTFASKTPEIWSSVRRRIQQLLSEDNFELQDNAYLLSKSLIPLSNVSMTIPFKIEGFSDFYASEHHASNVGKLFRGNENALLPNWKHIPVGYNGRASTVFPSGTNIKRPKGLIKSPTQDSPVFSPTKKLDFELEIGVFIGTGTPDGRRINVKNAQSYIFGLVLLNDWSARDIQSFEYQPLGPFLSKSFATSISHWVVPYEVFNEVMTPLPKQTPVPVDYLYQETPMQPDIKLRVELKTKDSDIRTIICETSSKELYWSMEQLLAHHTVNNCIMRPGDLLGSGTISGSEKGNWGSLLEQTFNGAQPIKLNDDMIRTFLEDGDSIIITGYCETSKGKIGFGVLEGMILPAVDD